jgi:DNA gyrase/topoisomerase IV subunit A
MKKSTLLAEFDQTVHLVSFSISSVFTKDDVIQILRNLEGVLKEYTSENKETIQDRIVLTTEQLDSLIETVTNEISAMDEYIIDDYDLSINDKEIQLDSISLNSCGIEEKVSEAVNGWLNDLNEDDCGC